MPETRITDHWPCPGCGADNDLSLRSCPRCQRPRRIEQAIAARPEPPAAEESWLPPATVFLYFLVPLSAFCVGPLGFLLCSILVVVDLSRLSREQKSRSPTVAVPAPAPLDGQDPWLPELTGWWVVVLAGISCPCTMGVGFLLLLPTLNYLFHASAHLYSRNPLPTVYTGSRVHALFAALAIVVPSAFVFAGVVGIFGMLLHASGGPSRGLELLLLYVAASIAFGVVALGLARGIFDGAPELSQRLLTALRQKFGEAGGALAAEVQGRDANRIRAVLDAVDTVDNLDDLRKLL